VFFGLGAVLAYLAHARAAAADPGAAAPAWRRRSYALSLALYALSLLSKSHLVTLAAILLVLDWFPLRRWRGEGWRRLVLEKVPYLVLAAPVALLTMRAHVPQTMTLAQVNLETRVVIAFRSLLAYLRLTILPVDVSPAYLHPGNVPHVGFLELLPLLAFVAITAGAIAVARRRPVFAAVWGVVLVMLAPVLGFLQNGPQSMAGRFTYVPGMALSLLAALGVVALYERLGSRTARGLVVAATAGVLAASAWLTVRDISWWKDDITFWNRSIELNPGVSGRQYFLRGMSWRHQGDWRRALSDLDEAEAIAVRKGYRATHEIVVARARVLREMGDLDAAITQFGRAIDVAPPEMARGYRQERGALYRARGNEEQARADLRLSGASE
jgi:hypothetical protein